MLTYIFAIAVIGFFNMLLKPRTSIQRRKIFLFLSFLILFMISAFRGYSVGVDVKIYTRLYNLIDYYDFSKSRFEIGFLYFMRTLYRVNPDPGFMLAVTSLINVGMVFLFIRHYSDDPLTAVFLYVFLRSYFSSMNIIRETLAVSISMAAYMILLKDLNKKRVVLSCAIIALASTFHAGAIVSFVPLIIWLILLHKKEEIRPLALGRVIVLISGAGFIGFNILLMIATRIFPRYVRYFGGRWGDSNYVAALAKVLISLVFLITGAMYLAKGNRSMTQRELFSFLLLGCALFMDVVSMRMKIWGRLAGFFSVYTSIFWAPGFLMTIRSGKERFLVRHSILLFSFAYMIVVLIFRPEWEGVVPYVLR